MGIAPNISSLDFDMKPFSNIIGLLIILLLVMPIQSCIFLPKTVPQQDQDCLLATKSMTLHVHTSEALIDEAVDEMVGAIASDCHEPECLLVVAPIVAISVGSLVVSGSIVVTGNTIHWIEKQGRCQDSLTQQTLDGLTQAAKNMGGTVIRTSGELIDWFRSQPTGTPSPNEDTQLESN